MDTENTIRNLYNVKKDDRLYISPRFYKKDSDNNFCLYIVHRTNCIVLEFMDGTNKYNPVFVGEIWQGNNNGKGEFAPIIREWTGKNIFWKFEKPERF